MTPREELEEVFFAVVEDPSESGFEAQRRAHPDVARSALDYLRDRHVRGVAPVESWETTPTLRQVLRLLLRTGGQTVPGELIALALDTGHPRELRPLSDVVLGVVPPDQLARAILDALAEDRPPRMRANARELAYYTFDAAGDDYAPSPELRARLSERL